MITKYIILEKTLDNITNAKTWVEPTNPSDVKEFYDYVSGVTDLADQLLEIENEQEVWTKKFDKLMKGV